MTRTPHDALFKAAFQDPDHAAGLLQRMLPGGVASAISWPSLKPEAGSFVDRSLADSHSDLLFSAQLRDGAQALLYLLVEHQSANDPDMPRRMLGYLMRIWERFRAKGSNDLPVTIPFVLSHAPEGWTAPRALEEMFTPRPDTIADLAKHVPRLTLLVEDLREIDDESLHARALEAFPKLALWLLRDGRDAERLRRGLADWADAFREALRAPRGVEAVAKLLRYVALVAGDLHHDDFHATIVAQIPEAEEVVMTVAEQLRAEGREEGKAEGREEGKAEGLTKALNRLLRERFGTVPTEYSERLDGAAVQLLDRYFERAMSARTLDAVFSD
ncbi:Rpn family recombination-promoting nuclease/putative transposase [Pseudenhygromyxa sp. WMMC2535]|uniref:Rpn family recombination-promoting nuclease/putative transposase n=1 Tax=Pseudenhygromyxa sp. WMMC2535 TaxID=2712867 RepID=UPI001556324A|nr:Rpn family recombination-promoting nuclease/putative transposase [Pseudenhygromyxa sp. WMMC2535]